MLTGELRSKIDNVWNAFWAGGIANPLEVIEQITCLLFIRGLDDAQAWLSQDCTGTAETAAAPWWRLVRHYRPDIRTLVVRRPVAEVLDSLLRLDMRGVCRFDPGVLAARQMARERPDHTLQPTALISKDR